MTTGVTETDQQRYERALRVFAREDLAFVSFIVPPVNDLAVLVERWKNGEEVDDGDRV